MACDNLHGGFEKMKIKAAAFLNIVFMQFFCTLYPNVRFKITLDDKRISTISYNFTIYIFPLY